MAELKIRELSFELRTVKLTKALFKQLPTSHDMSMTGLLNEHDSPKRELVVGWVHGSVLNVDYDTWLILKTGPGTYMRYQVMHTYRAKYPQLYIV